MIACTVGGKAWRLEEITGSMPGLQEFYVGDDIRNANI